MKRYGIFGSFTYESVSNLHPRNGGYATNETKHMISIPELIVSKFLLLMKKHPARMFGTNHYAEVVFDYDEFRIVRFVTSISHTDSVTVSDFRHIIKSLINLVSIEADVAIDDSAEIVITDERPNFKTIESVAKETARDIVSSGKADRCKVEISYFVEEVADE